MQKRPAAKKAGSMNIDFVRCGVTPKWGCTVFLFQRKAVVQFLWMRLLFVVYFVFLRYSIDTSQTGPCPGISARTSAADGKKEDLPYAGGKNISNIQLKSK